MITNESWIKIADEIGSNSYAKRAKVGAIIVKDGNIVSIGYNGTVSGADNSCEVWDSNKFVTKKDVLHAESNAISKCARSVHSSDGAHLYVSLSPCFNCSKLIIQSGITKVYYKDEYRDSSGIDFLKENGVYVEQIPI